MKKIYSTILFLVLSCVCALAQNSEIEFRAGSFRVSTENISSKLGGYAEDWPWDVNGNDLTALVRVKLENFSADEAAKLTFKFPSHTSASKIDFSKIGSDSEIWIFLNSVNNSYIEALLDGYGMSNRYPIAQLLEPEKIYEITLSNKKTVTISIDSNPEDAVVVMDDVPTYRTTPTQIENVTMGLHTIKLSIDGKLLAEKDINVTSEDISFDFDIRKRKTITFTSDPKGAAIYVDNDKAVKGYTPCTMTLPYGSYKIKALTEDDENDEMSITVGDHTPAFVALAPTHKGKVTLYAEFQGKKVAADLDVNNRYYGEKQYSYTLSLPYGSYDMRMTYDGRYKNKTVRISDKSDQIQTISIPKKSTVTMPWERQYDVDPMGFSLGYIQKNFKMKPNDGSSYERMDIWDKRNEWLRGFQAGVYFQPAFNFGLGLHTGLYYELYYSKDKDKDPAKHFNQFFEHSLYVPVHLFFRMPFSEKVSLAVHGGLGLNCGLLAEFNSDDPNNITMPVTDVYGVANMKRFNLAGEGAVALRIYSVQLYAQYAVGLTDNAVKGLDYKVYQNKISCGISWVFGREYNY